VLLCSVLKHCFGENSKTIGVSPRYSNHNDQRSKNMTYEENSEDMELFGFKTRR